MSGFFIPIMQCPVYVLYVVLLRPMDKTGFLRQRCYASFPLGQDVQRTN